MRKIPVTRGFDKTDVIGVLTLVDAVDIPVDSVFALAYHVLEGTIKKPVKIQVEEVSLIPDSNYLPYLKDQEDTLEQKRPLNEEDYTTWSNEKFCRLIARWREDAHMAGTHDAYVAYKRMLEPAEAAFKQLHPRAYQNFEKRFHEQFQ